MTDNRVIPTRWDCNGGGGIIEKWGRWQGR